MPLIRTAPLLVVALLLGCDRTGITINTRESSAAAALFEEFETVVYSKAQLLSSSDNYGQLSKREFSNLRFPFSYLRRALEWLGDKAPVDILASSTAVLLGAQHFEAPKGLGPVHSQRCYVAVLDARSAIDIRRYFRTEAVSTAAGASVWSWGVNLGEFGEEDPRASVVYAAVVANSYLLVANSLGVLQSVARRLTTPSNDSDHSLRAIRDWDSVSRHELWGYRRYRHTTVANRMAAGLSDVTPSAEALIFAVNPTSKTAAVRLLAADDGTATKINASMTEANIDWPPLKTSGVGMWETTILFSGDERSADRVFVSWGLLGFGVYL